MGAPPCKEIYEVYSSDMIYTWWTFMGIADLS